MKLRISFFVFFTFLSILCNAQNMKEGFTYLENGNYKKAEAFFKNILLRYPLNKTAKLCYGRAIGLSGDAKKSVEIFTHLLEQYPEDLEIKLNYAESLLWSKDFQNAKVYYQELVEQNSKSFAALLGYANALSNLKIYDQALVHVNKALLIIPRNANALTSKKYIHLGYANEHLQKKDISTALHLLNEISTIFPNDLENLENLANVHIISNDLSEAKRIFQKIGTSPQNTLISLNGLALVSHLKNKDKEALAVSAKAITLINADTDTIILQQTNERYVQALIWNRKYREAKTHIEQITKMNSNKNSILALRATLNMYKGNFKKSITTYNQMLKNDSTSFDGNLGKANALKASRLYKKAYNAGYKAAAFYNNQKDIVTFLKKLDNEFTPYLETKTSYSSDSGNNEARTFSAGFIIPLSTKLKVNTSYRYRTTHNDFLHKKATSNSFLGGLSYQFIPAVVFNASLGAAAASSSNSYTQLLADISLHITPYKLQNLEVGYARKLEDFNADLISSELVQNNYFVNYSFITNFNFGWFSQYYYTSQNDSNKRNLFFASAYYKLMHSPILKAGFNYQFIRFKKQVPNSYFSPEKFIATEVFIDVMKEENNSSIKELFYGLNAATGFQFIEDNKRQHIYRIQGLLGYKFSERSSANIFVNHSNIASVSVTGFTFTEIGFKLKWYLSNRPAFKKIER